MTILRSANGLQLPISCAEALAAARQLQGWSVSGDSELTFSDERGHCTLWHRNGELWTGLHDTWVIQPMLELAHALGARLRGGEFETYAGPQETYRHPDDEQLERLAPAASAPLLAKELAEQRRICNWIWGFFAVLGGIGFLIGKWFEGR